jgi:phospholipase A1
MRRIPTYLLISLLFSSAAFAAKLNDVDTAVSLVTQQAHDYDAKLASLLKTLTPTERTALAHRLQIEAQAASNPYSLLLYQPSYVLPFYYTDSPDHAIYNGQTPDNQSVMNAEFKAQLSVQVPVILHLFSEKNSLNIGYTQDSFWQVYAQSQYFRETNYEPELFFRRVVNSNLMLQTAFVHQSNGRGGTFERSWNRIYGEAAYSGSNWLVDFKPWVLILKKESSDVHNPDIQDYLGNSRLLLSYKFGKTTLSFMTRNNVQSHFKHGAEQLTFTFPLHGHFRGLVYAWSGYGQSLIEYDHYTNAFAIGIAFNDWI